MINQSNMAKRATCQLGYLWDICGICVEYLWDMYGWGNMTLIRDHSNSLVLPTADHHGCLRAFHFCSHLSCELSVSLKLFNQLKPLNTRKEKNMGSLGEKWWTQLQTYMLDVRNRFPDVMESRKRLVLRAARLRKPRKPRGSRVTQLDRTPTILLKASPILGRLVNFSCL